MLSNSINLRARSSSENAINISSSTSLLSVGKKIDELQEILKKKDEDMKLMEERYKRYVEKARTVSQHCLTLNSSIQHNGAWPPP